MAHVVSVNVGTPQPVDWDRIGRTAIVKSPVTERVAVARLGIAGDQVADTKHHGGVDQAVYAFAREDLDWWGDELGSELQSGAFGENLTTTGIDINEAEIGEQWRIGTAVFEVAGVRIPCNTFRARIGALGLDNTGWVKRFAAVSRPGPYLRVLEAGELAAGDAIEVVHRPGHGNTVTAHFKECMGLA